MTGGMGPESSHPVRRKQRVNWIGIQGPSGAGKSSLATQMAQSFKQCAVIGLDRFYRPFTRLGTDPLIYNFDSPQALDWDCLLKFTEAIALNGSGIVPRFDYSTGERLSGECVQVGEIAIIEGLWPFVEPRLDDILALRIYIDAPPDIRLIRRLRRDLVDGSRGWSLEAALAYYERYVRPMEGRFVLPGEVRADLCLDGTADMDANVDAALRLAKARC